jgi:predicted XRE-type DNA-binding protein
MALHSCASGHLGCIAPRHLKWGDHNDNMTDMVADGRSSRGQRAAFAKLTTTDVLAIRRAVGTQEEIARRFGVTQTNISAILRGKSWAHVP